MLMYLYFKFVIGKYKDPYGVCFSITSWYPPSLEQKLHIKVVKIELKRGENILFRILPSHLWSNYIANGFV